jgi:hypothetical protein
MLWAKKVLRISAAVAVAIGAAHTAESLKGQDAQQSVLLSAVQSSENGSASTSSNRASVVPQSASLNGGADAQMGDLVGITAVAATMPEDVGGHCRPSLQLSAVPGAMIYLSLSAPCNRNERIVVRHSGLSFAVKTRADGAAAILLPALKPDALVAVYLADAHLLLGSVMVPDAADFSRFAIIGEFPTEVELRVTEGDKVLVGSPAMQGVDLKRVMSLGSKDVASPVIANVYTTPGKDLGDAEITGELRITPATCGRTLRLEAVYSTGGVATTEVQTVAVPLCGTSGDILVLKNLAPALKLAAPM